MMNNNYTNCIGIQYSDENLMRQMQKLEPTDCCMCDGQHIYQTILLVRYPLLCRELVLNVRLHWILVKYGIHDVESWFADTVFGGVGLNLI